MMPTLEELLSQARKMKPHERCSEDPLETSVLKDPAATSNLRPNKKVQLGQDGNGHSPKKEVGTPAKPKECGYIGYQNEPFFSGEEGLVAKIHTSSPNHLGYPFYDVEKDGEVHNNHLSGSIELGYAFG